MKKSSAADENLISANSSGDPTANQPALAFYTWLQPVDQSTYRLFKGDQQQAQLNGTVNS